MYLSKREQQIMEIVYRLGRASANEVVEALPDGPTNSTVRTQLGILERKGQLTHVELDGRFIYAPVAPAEAAGKSALDRVLETFYEGSVSRVVATLLDRRDADLTPEELDELTALIERAKREGR